MKSAIIAVLLVWLMVIPVHAGSALIVDRVITTEKIIALTMEDVESVADLEKVLTLCKEKDVRVSFFSPSYFISSHPLLAKQALVAGHEFGNYGVKHEYWDEFREEDIIKELRAASVALKKVVGVESIIVRPTYNQYEDDVISAITNFNIRAIVVRGITVDDSFMVEDKMVIHNGDIINVDMQDECVVVYLAEFISSLKSKGYKIVTVSELMTEASGK